MSQSHQRHWGCSCLVFTAPRVLHLRAEIGLDGLPCPSAPCPTPGSYLLQGLGMVTNKATNLAQVTPEVQSEQAPVFSDTFSKMPVYLRHWCDTEQPAPLLSFAAAFSWSEETSAREEPVPSGVSPRPFPAVRGSLHFLHQPGSGRFTAVSPP